MYVCIYIYMYMIIKGYNTHPRTETVHLYHIVTDLNRFYQPSNIFLGIAAEVFRVPNLGCSCRL